jgi:hypothetical protein
MTPSLYTLKRKDKLLKYKLEMKVSDCLVGFLMKILLGSGANKMAAIQSFLGNFLQKFAQANFLVSTTFLVAH